MTPEELIADSAEPRLNALYRNATENQWIPGETFQWENNWSYGNPLEMSGQVYEVDDQSFWAALGAQGTVELSRNFQVWRLSQMLHAEVAALAVCSKLTLLHTDLLAKMCCTMQAADEARHVDVFKRLLQEIGESPYEVNGSLQTLIDQIERDSRVSILSLGMQILIEGVGIGAFRRITIATRSAFVRTLFSYIMKDEARHFALGRLTLSDMVRVRDEVPLAELDDLLDESLTLLDEYLQPTDVLQRFGSNKADARGMVSTTAFAKQFRRTVFGQLSRPIVDLGLSKTSRSYRRLVSLAGELS